MLSFACLCFQAELPPPRCRAPLALALNARAPAAAAAEGCQIRSCTASFSHFIFCCCAREKQRIFVAGDLAHPPARPPARCSGHIQCREQASTGTGRSRSRGEPDIGSLFCNRGRRRRRRSPSPLRQATTLLPRRLGVRVRVRTLPRSRFLFPVRISRPCRPSVRPAGSVRRLAAAGSTTSRTSSGTLDRRFHFVPSCLRQVSRVHYSASRRRQMFEFRVSNSLSNLVLFAASDHRSRTVRIRNAPPLLASSVRLLLEQYRTLRHFQASLYRELPVLFVFQ